MSQDDNIRILAEDITSSSSEKGEHTEEGKKTNGEGTQDIQAQQGQKEKGGEGQIVEPKIEEETIGQTPREKRMERRVEKEKKPQMKVVAAKADTQKQKGKRDPEMATIQTETVDTGTSTGSMEKEQQRGKSPKILAREVAVVLDILRTPPKQKWKRKRQASMYFKASRSTQIKVGRPQPQSKEPIVIEDTTPKPKEGSPSKIYVTYK